MKKKINEPDFIGGQGPLTKEEEFALSQYFARKKNKKTSHLFHFRLCFCRKCENNFAEFLTRILNIHLSVNPVQKMNHKIIITKKKTR